MASTAFKGAPVKIAGKLPKTGEKAPDFRLTDTQMQDFTLNDHKGRKVVLNIFPSIDTGVCAASVREFNKRASGLDNTVVICVSRDLPLAHKRFCGAEGIENVVSASQFKDFSFTDGYGVEMLEGPLPGLMARSVVVVDENGTVKHTELVADITNEPNYEAAISALG